MPQLLPRWRNRASVWRRTWTRWSGAAVAHRDDLVAPQRAERAEQLDTSRSTHAAQHAARSVDAVHRDEGCAGAGLRPRIERLEEAIVEQFGMGLDDRRRVRARRTRELEIAEYEQAKEREASRSSRLHRPMTGTPRSATPACPEKT